MRPKLIGFFLIIGLVPLIAVAIFSLVRAQDALNTEAYNPSRIDPRGPEGTARAL